MPFALRVIVGGLVTVVQENKNLWAIMKADKDHTPVFNPAGRSDGVGDESIEGKDIDLWSALDGGVGNIKKVRLPGALQISAIAGGVDATAKRGHVKREYYGAFSSSMSSRIRLPIPAFSPRPVNTVLARANFKNPVSSTPLGFVTGQLEFVFECNGKVLIETKTGKHEYGADATILFEHRPTVHGAGRHGKGDPMRHAMAHFELLETPKVPVANIEIVADENYALPMHMMPIMPDGMQFSAHLEFGPKAIDPVDCTVGSGCPDPQDDPNCGDG